MREYLVWQTLDERIDGFELVDDEYRPLLADDTGVIRSKVFPGLRTDADALRSVAMGPGRSKERARASGARFTRHSSPGFEKPPAIDLVTDVRDQLVSDRAPEVSMIALLARRPPTLLTGVSVCRLVHLGSRFHS